MRGDGPAIYSISTPIHFVDSKAANYIVSFHVAHAVHVILT